MNLSALFLLIAVFPATAMAQGGTVRGKVPFMSDGDARIAIEKYTGKISGQVAPPPPTVAGVWLESRRVKAPVKVPDITVRQTNYQFSQSLLTVPVGTRIFFPNDDVDHHNVFSLSRTRRFDLGRYRKGDPQIPSVDFPKPGLVNLRCEIHEHMRATVLVVDTPYYTTTDQQGNFTLKNVASGDYVLHAQIDKRTRWFQPVTVKAGLVLKVDSLRKK